MKNEQRRIGRVVWQLLRRGLNERHALKVIVMEKSFKWHKHFFVLIAVVPFLVGLECGLLFDRLLTINGNALFDIHF